MAKQMMQDILAKNDASKENKETDKEFSPRKAAVSSTKNATNAIEEPLPETAPRSKEAKEGGFGGAPAFPPIETSPIFEKMKQHNKDRGSFSDEFSTNQNGVGRRGFGKIAIALGAVLLLGAFLYGFFFHRATLSITPKHADVTVQNQEFTAGGSQSNEGTETLSFQLMTLSDENSADLVATGEKNVVSKSSGKIVIYNNFSAQNQPLIKNTRFQAPDGKIYRIHDSIVVPGQKVVGGKSTPGSFEVDVYADAVGPEYNIGLVDFTIPGFKGSPRFDKIYARSKTAMTGGASGLVKVVSDTDIQKAKETLTAGLKEKLLAQAIAQKPKGMVLYKDAVFYNFTDSMDNTATGADNKSVKLTMKGSLTATLFDAQELSKRIVKASVAPVDVAPNDKILVTNIEELAFAVKNENKGESIALPKDGDTYIFSLNGVAKAVWQVDTASLAGKLAGTKKADYTAILAEFSGIEKANAAIRPFWKTKFPSDVAKIHVEIAQF
jgi:hypothetical protein